MSRQVPPGSQISHDFFVSDANGAAVTGLVATTLPTLTASIGNNTADVSIAMVDLASLTTPWASGGVKERALGWYRLDVPLVLTATDGNHVQLIGLRVFAETIEVKNQLLIGITDISIPTPSITVGQCMGALVMVDATGALEQNVIVEFQGIIPPSGTGIGYSSVPILSSPSDGSGIITQNFPSGEAWYQWRRGNGPWKKFKTAIDSSSFLITNNIGNP